MFGVGKQREAVGARLVPKSDQGKGKGELGRRKRAWGAGAGRGQGLGHGHGQKKRAKRDGGAEGVEEEEEVPDAAKAAAVKKTAQQRWTEEVAVKFPFESQYADHFESPARAYEDLAPLLRRVAARLCSGGESPRSSCESVRIYDPFYCDGAVVDRLANVGFPNVLNECVDFYARVSEGTVPAHDVVVTNPPYSGEHKERSLRWAASENGGRPWFQLLPNYVATKGYFGKLFPGSTSPTPAAVEPVVFLVPSAKYEFEHPEGTGKDASPFFSVWFCGGLQKADLHELEKELGPGVTLVTSVKAMGDGGHLRLAKRGNPKQRRKARLAQGGGQ